MSEESCRWQKVYAGGFDQISWNAQDDNNDLYFLVLSRDFVLRVSLFLAILYDNLIFSLTFGMSDLGGNVIYTNLGFGVAEAAGFGFVSFLIDNPTLGRRKGNMYIAAFATAGCVSALIGDILKLKAVKIVSAFIGKLGASAAFGVAYIYASELFPTPMRGIGVGTASACGRIGGVLSPFIADLSRVASYLPFAVFSIFGLALILASKSSFFVHTVYLHCFNNFSQHTSFLRH